MKLVRCLAAFLALVPAMFAQQYPGDGQDPTPPYECSAQASSTPNIRAEGHAELISALVITCQGGSPIPVGQIIPQGNLTVTLGPSLAVTSRMLGGGGFSESLLLLDEPTISSQYPCETANGVCAAYGNGTGASYYGSGPQTPSLPQNRNVFQGVLRGSNQVVFMGIPFDPPGRDKTRTYRIENIRINASQLTVPAGGAAAVTASISLAGQVSVTIANSTLTAALARASFNASVRDANSTLAAPSGITVGTSAPGTMTRVATLRFSELLPTVFRTRTVAPARDPDTAPPPADQNAVGSIYRSETGFYNASFGTYGNRGNLGLAGLADSGTRLRAIFDKVPEGVRIFVAVANDNPASEWLRLTSTNADGSGAFKAEPANANGLAEVTLTRGAGVAVWEVLRTDTALTGNLDVGVYVTYPALARSDFATVALDLAPISNPSSTVLPRFSGGGAALPLVSFDPGGATLPLLRATPATLSFTVAQGGAAVSRELAVEALLGTVSANIDYTITQTGQFALQLGGSTGRTPSRITITASPGSLAPGRYTAALRFDSSGAGNSPFTVPVELIVTGRLSITTLAPNPVTAGRPAFNLTVIGTGFVTGSAVRIGDQTLTPATTTATQLTVQIPAALVASPRSLPVVVVNPDQGESNVVQLVVDAAPVITSLTPDTVPAGQAATVGVIGRNFARGMEVRVGGQAVPSTFVDTSRINANIPASSLGSAAAVDITVAASDGTASNAVPLRITASLTLEAPPVQAGDRGVDVTIRGSGFVAGTNVQATPPGGTAVNVTPTSVGATAIALRLPANLIAQAGAVQLRVVPPSGAPSSPLTLTVQPAPSISGLSPASAIAGSSALNLSVQGANFLTGSTVRWNGTALTTQFGSAAMLSAMVPANLLTTRATASVTVEGPGGAASNAASFEVTLPALPSLSYGGLNVATSGSRADATLTLGAPYPAALRVQFTLAFRPDGNLRDDRAIVFTNGQRQIDVNLAAGSTGPAQVSLQTGSTAGVITLTPRFFAGTQDITPASVSSHTITVARAAPAFAVTDLRCARSTTNNLTITVSGLSNTLEVRQAAFTFEPTAGESLTSSQFTVDVTQIFNTWFLNAAATGTFLYTQVFTVQPSTAAIASVSVSLTNAVGASASRAAQCTP